MPAPYFSEVTHERAYEIAEELVKPFDKYQGPVMTVISGTHPKLGDIHISIPPLGDSLVFPALLPVVSQQFDL